MKSSYVLKAILTLCLLSGSIQVKAADSEQLKSCYESAYKKIFVEIMGISKDTLRTKNNTDEAFEKALNKAALYAVYKNKLIKDININGKLHTIIYQINSPEDLLGVKKGKALSLAGVERALGDALFYGLGTPNAIFYAEKVNITLATNEFSDQIKSVPECVDIF